MSRSVIRIQGPDGKGPFTSENQCDVEKEYRAFRSQIHRKYMPSVCEIYSGFSCGKHICAYHDVAHMCKFWYVGALEAFIKAGFRILHIEVADCFVHESQCVFESGQYLSATEIDFESIRRLLPNTRDEVVRLWTNS